MHNFSCTRNVRMIGVVENAESTFSMAQLWLYSHIIYLDNFVYSYLNYWN